MRRFLLLAGFALTFTLSSCQCSWKPDVGPVEDEETTAQVTPTPAQPLQQVA